MISPVLTTTQTHKAVEVLARSQSSNANPFKALWAIDPSLTFLNHGSYGAVPRSVGEYRASLLARMEWDAVRFYKVDLERLMDQWRHRMGGFIGCAAKDLAALPNATIAIATAIHNTDWKTGDEVLLTDHEYMSGVNELRRLEQTVGIKIVWAAIPFPIQSPKQILDSVFEKLTNKTRMVMVSQITSSTSLIFPVAEIIAECNRRGIEVLLDGTHAPGQIPVNVRELDATYFVGSGHKWISAPKGTGFMYVHPSKQEGFRPLSISSRGHKIRPERALFLRDFDYVGTDDYSKVLAMTASLDFYDTVVPGGWDEVMATNHNMVIKGRDLLCRELADFGVMATAPDHMTGSMTTLLLPEPPLDLVNRPTQYDDALQDKLVDKHSVVAPIWRLTADNRRVMRISAQLYNSIEEYQVLADALKVELAAERAGNRL